MKTRIGWICLALSFLLPWSIHPATTLGRDLLDSAQGLFLGAAIGCLLLFTKGGSPCASR